MHPSKPYSLIFDFVAAVRDNLATLADIGDFLALFADDRYRMETDAAAILEGEDAKRVVTALFRLLNAESPSEGDEGAASPKGDARSSESFAVLVRRIGEQTGFRGKNIYLPIRAAITGRLHGPELDLVFALLSPKSLRKRVEKALALS